jgi:hypothetical protein
MPDMCDLAKFLKWHDFAAIFYSNIRLAALHYAASYGNNYFRSSPRVRGYGRVQISFRIVAAQMIIVKTL